MIPVEPRSENFQRIAKAYRLLAHRRAKGLTFVSDWNGSHGYIDQFVDRLASAPLTELGALCDYAFPRKTRSSTSGSTENASNTPATTA